jgi:hypothetical protein
MGQNILFPRTQTMKNAMKNGQKTGSMPDNALAKQALENIAKIDKEAQHRKMEQLESLKSARAAILERINELNHQLAQIDKAVSAITGQPLPTRGTGERKPRRNLEEVRERVGRWLEARRGQKFMARDLVQEFAELDGVAVSIFIKPLVEGGLVKTDSSDGIRRTKYFVEG